LNPNVLFSSMVGPMAKVWLTETFCTRTALPALLAARMLSAGSLPGGRNR